MFDISKTKLDLNCTDCRQPFSVTLGDVSLGKKVKCPKCGVTIVLQDADGSAAKSVRDVNAGFMKLDDAIKKINRG
jgi:DNA-directed RNA polymerase subunit RPC12/RpoP